MMAGGIHDQIGGGFHRYATDRAWRVPHFEKMLYDNALLAAIYLDAYQVTGREDFAACARDVLLYLARDMAAPTGGFYAASDADSEGEEGRYFVWTATEIAAELDPAESAAVSAYYGVTAEGSFRGANILYVPRALPVAAAELGTEPARLAAVLERARRRLLARRATRVAPHVDTKILAAWNGLAISAFARAGAVLAEPAFIERARAGARFVLDHMRTDGRLRRSHADGAAYQEGFLDDHAFVAAGLLDLYEATFETTWLEEATALQATLRTRFWDGAGGAFYLTSDGHEPELARAKPDEDGAVPSGNAVAAENLLRLAEFTGNEAYRRDAEDTVRALAVDLERVPARAPRLLAVVDFLLDEPREIAIVHPARGETDARLLATVRRHYLPNRMLTVAVEGADLDRQRTLIPLVAGKSALRGASTAYVCERGVCALPTSDPEVLGQQLARVRPLPEPPSR
jgi:uncharacterized protein YyaL (SSP411 family)